MRLLLLFLFSLFDLLVPVNSVDLFLLLLHELLLDELFDSLLVVDEHVLVLHEELGACL